MGSTLHADRRPPAAANYHSKRADGREQQCSRKANTSTGFPADGLRESRRRHSRDQHQFAGDLPAPRSISATATCPFSSARSSGVLPSPFARSGLAPASSRSRTI